MANPFASQMPVGARVGAILSATQQEVRLLGYGTFLGDLPTPDWEDIARENLPMVREAAEEYRGVTVEDLVERNQAMYASLAKLRPGRVIPPESQIRAEAEHEYARWREYAEMDDEALVQALRESPMCVNPCIQLDNGTQVWGRQCWWGSEERVRQEIGNRRVVVVALDDQPATPNAGTRVRS